MVGFQVRPLLTEPLVCTLVLEASIRGICVKNEDSRASPRSGGSGVEAANVHTVVWESQF